MERRKLWKTDWVLLAALFFLVSLHFWFPNLRTGPTHDTYSSSADGKKAFYLLVRQQSLEYGLTVSRRLSSLSRLDSEFGFNGLGTPVLCVLGPQRNPTAEEWEGLLEWVSYGGKLVYAARFNREKFESDAVGFKIESLDERMDVNADDIDTDLLSSNDVMWISNSELAISSEATELVTVGENVQAALFDYGDGQIVVVASDYIFSNQALAWEDNSNGELAYRLLETVGGDGDIYFDESLNITGTPKVVGLLFDPFLRPVTVQLLIGLLLFAWWKWRRFGPLLPKLSAPRRNIVDHTDSLGTLNYKTQNGSGALRSYLKQLYSELHLKSFKGREERVLEPIALRMGMRLEDVKALILDASKSARQKTLARKDAAEYIRRLALFRQAALRRAGKQRDSGIQREIESA